jgi:hypothetical protein
MQKTDLVIVSEESLQQDFTLRTSAYVYKRQDDIYKSTSRSLSAALIDNIKFLAMAAKGNQAPVIEEYGITQDSIKQNLDLMVREASASRIDKFSDAPQALKGLFSSATIADHAKNKILTRTDRGNSSNTITIAPVGQDALTISSNHEYGLRLPWTVSYQGESWLSYARELPMLLAELVSEESARLLRQQPSWHYSENYQVSDAEAEDLSFFAHYGRSVAHHFEADQIRKQTESLAGYELAATIYDIDGARGLNIPNMLVRDGEYILENQPYLRLKTKEAWLVDTIGWTADKDFTDLMAKHKVIEDAANKIQWLAAWKAAAPGRSILAEILKDNQESWFDDEGLETIWDKHEIATKPDFHFYLCQDDKCIYDIFVGFPFEMAVVTTIEARAQDGVEIVFDKIAVKTPSLINHHAESQFYIPLPPVRSRPYAVVSNAGVVEAISNPGNKNAMRVVGHPGEEESDSSESGAYPNENERHEDPYTWDEVEDLINRNLTDSPLAVQSDQVEFGLVGRDGLIVLAPQFDFIERFHEGLAKIRATEGKFGFIDTRGKVVIEPQFDRAHHFRNGLTAAQKNRKWGYIDSNGNTIIPFIYEYAHPFFEGVAAVRLGYLYGYIDEAGNWAIEPRFSRARRFINGLAVVQIDGKHGYIDRTGKLLGNKLYERLGQFWEGMAAFVENDKWGYLNKAGKEIIAAQFKNANPFRDGVAMVRLTAEVAQAMPAVEGEDKPDVYRPYFIDKVGNLVDPVRTLGGSRLEWHANVMRSRDKALRRFARAHAHQNDSNTFNLVTVHASAGWFKEGLCPVEYQGKWGAINTNGTLVLPAKFEELGAREREWFTEGLIPCCEDGKWGAIDITGTYIFRTDFEQIGLFYKGFAAVRQGTKYGFINNKGEVIITPQFDTVGGFDKHGLAHVGLLKQTQTSSFPARFV